MPLQIAMFNYMVFYIMVVYRVIMCKVVSLRITVTVHVVSIRGR